MSETIVNKTNPLSPIRNWEMASDKLKRLRDEVRRAEEAVDRTHALLVNLYVPKEALPDHKVFVWDGDDMLKIYVGKLPGDHHITIVKNARKTALPDGA